MSKKAPAAARKTSPRLTDTDTDTDGAFTAPRNSKLSWKTNLMEDIALQPA